MDEKEMTNEENYHFDVAGYLLLPGVLKKAEVKACNEALEQPGAGAGALDWTAPGCEALLVLRDHPVVLQYLEQLLGENFCLDRRARLLGAGAGEEEGTLSGGSEWQDWSRAYRQHNGNRFCQGVRVVWALAEANEGAGGLVVAPASHNSTVDAPRNLSSGADDMGVVVQPLLQAGDVLLCADSVMRGLRPRKGQGPQRLLECGYINSNVRPSADTEIRAKAQHRDTTDG